MEILEFLFILTKLLLLLLITVFMGFLFFINKTFLISDFPLYMLFGIVEMSLIMFILGIFGIDIINSGIFIILIAFVYLPLIFRKIIFAKLHFSEIIFLLLCFIISLVYSAHTLWEGTTNNGDLRILGANAHDALWHIGLFESIKNSFPIQNPIYSGELLYNYHYLTDIYFSFLSEFSGFDSFTVYLKISPLILSLLFVHTTFCLCKKITANLTLAFLATLLLIFGSGFTYLAPFFFEGASAGQSSFWLDQPIRYVINQQLVLGLAVANLILILLFKIRLKEAILIGILLGSLAGIKAYGFILFGIPLALIGLKKLVVGEKFLAAGLLFGALAGIFILKYITSNNFFPFIFEPGWYIKTLYVSPDRLNYSTWEIHRQLFYSTGNWPRFVYLWVEGLILFLLGNIGIKILAFFIGIFYLTKIKIHQNIFIFSIIVTLIGVLFPIFFLQKGIVWNSIQFMHFVQVPLIVILLILIKQLPFRNQRLILILLLMLSLPTTITTYFSSFREDAYINYDKSLVEDILKVRSIPDSAQILVGDSLNGDSLIPALSGRKVYFADTTILTILNVNYEERRKYVLDVEQSSRRCKQNQYLITSRKFEKEYDLYYQGHKLNIYRC